MYDAGGKLLNGIKSMYVNSLGCVRVKGFESECFRINSGVRQVCIMSSWLFNANIDAVMKEVKMGIGKRGGRFQKEGREWKLSGLLYEDHLVLCGETEEELRPIRGHFVEVYRRRRTKVNAGKSKVMLLRGKDGLKCEVCVKGYV